MKSGDPFESPLLFFVILTKGEMTKNTVFSDSYFFASTRQTVPLTESVI